MHLAGRCDDQALDAALSCAMDGEPVFHAHLDLAWRGGKNLFLWRFDTERPRLEIYDHTALPAPESISRWFHDRMKPLLIRNMDLATEFPVRLQLHHLPGNQHLFMFIFHHAIADAARSLAFLRETLAGYHERVKSVAPSWASSPPVHAVADRKTRSIEPWPRFFRNIVRDAFRYPLSRVAVPAGDGDGTANRTIVHIEITDENLLAAMKSRGRGDGGGLTDLLMAAVDLAVEEWNNRRGITSDVMLNFLVVNGRGRESNEGAATYMNPLAPMPVPLCKDDRRTTDLLLKTIIERRKDGLSRGLDVHFTNEMLRTIDLARRLPFAARKKLIYPLITLRNTLFLSNAGILWPSLSAKGKPTGDSAIVEAGDLEIRDFFMSVGGIRTWPLYIITQSFRRKLYLEYISGGNLLTEKNILDFNEVLLRKIANYL